MGVTRNFADYLFTVALTSELRYIFYKIVVAHMMKKHEVHWHLKILKPLADWVRVTVLRTRSKRKKWFDNMMAVNLFSVTSWFVLPLTLLLSVSVLFLLIIIHHEHNYRHLTSIQPNAQWAPCSVEYSRIVDGAHGNEMCSLNKRINWKLRNR